MTINGIAVSLLAGFALLATPAIAADKDNAYTVSVEDAAAKVGEPTAVMVKVTTVEGFKFSKSYRNRIIELSALEDAVSFDKRVVRGSLENGSLLFKVGVTPVKAGSHPINGVFRIGFHNGEQLSMVSVPLTATVTGEE